jgi:hypothetical protein
VIGWSFRRELVLLWFAGADQQRRARKDLLDRLNRGRLDLARLVGLWQRNGAPGSEAQSLHEFGEARCSAGSASNFYADVRGRGVDVPIRVLRTADCVNRASCAP